MTKIYPIILNEILKNIHEGKIHTNDLIRVQRDNKFQKILLNDQIGLVLPIKKIYYDWDIISYDMRNQIELINVEYLIEEIKYFIKH